MDDGTSLVSVTFALTSALNDFALNDVARLDKHRASRIMAHWLRKCVVHAGSSKEVELLQAPFASDCENRKLIAAGRVGDRCSLGPPTGDLWLPVRIPEAAGSFFIPAYGGSAAGRLGTCTTSTQINAMALTDSSSPAARGGGPGHSYYIL